MPFKFLSALFVGVLLASHVFAATMPAAPLATTTTQLPRNVRPVDYRISITPDATDLRFAGHAEIVIDVVRATRRITLNADKLKFAKVELVALAGQESVAVVGTRIDQPRQTATFETARPLAKGRYRLLLDYTGTIGTQASGLFALDYESAGGRQRALYTQFENSYARSVFPSWDEPAFRTPFSLSLDVPAGEMAISNMPVEQVSESEQGRQRISFATSPPMSTYLLFFATGDFERRALHAGDTELGVVTKRGSLAQAEFALTSSAQILAEFNDYFAMPYPLPKLDNVAAPGNSEFFGAMENWGAIFSFERALLLDPSISTARDKQYVFSTAAHEIAHQWFGNLVTMSWWDDLWLNEGFASWMDARTTRRLHPEWNTHLDIVGNREGAMEHDALASTHAVVTPIATVEQASQAFDSITYEKGQAVITMLEAYVGEDAWRDGVRRYIKKHAYGNTVSDDLWREIELAAARPVKMIAEGFIRQPGIPLVRVAQPHCLDGQTQLRLTQGEYSADRPHKRPLRWAVPIIAESIGGAPGSTAVRALVGRGGAVMKLDGCAPVIVNAGQTGYYRTLYSARHLQDLVKSLPAMASIDQMGLVADAWALGRSGHQALSVYLDLIQTLAVDADPQIWGNVAENFAQLNEDLSADKPTREAFRQFARGRLRPVLARVGWTTQSGESDTMAILRGEMIEALSVLGDEAVIGEAQRRFAAQAGDPAAVPAALRKSILAVVARHASAQDWQRLRVAANEEKSTLARNQLFEFLAAAENKLLAQRALDLALTGEAGETNAARLISRVARLHPTLAFDFALAHYEDINQKIDAASRSRYYPELASHAKDPAMIGKLRAYGQKHLDRDARRDLEAAIAEVRYRVTLVRQRLPALMPWLRANPGA